MEISKYLFQILVTPFIISSIARAEVITSPPVTNFGDWGVFSNCSEGTFTQAFRLKTQARQGSITDDTAVNGIELFCGDPTDSSTKRIKSSEGYLGSWGQVISCLPETVMSGFQLRVEGAGIVDQTATNNVRIFCSDQRSFDGDGLEFGDWSPGRRCRSNQGVCGMQTQVQKNQGIGDDTALNNVAMECCDFPTPEPPTTTEEVSTSSQAETSEWTTDLSETTTYEPDTTYVPDPSTTVMSNASTTHVPDPSTTVISNASTRSQFV